MFLLQGRLHILFLCLNMFKTLKIQQYFLKHIKHSFSNCWNKTENVIAIFAFHLSYSKEQNSLKCKNRCNALTNSNNQRKYKKWCIKINLRLRDRDLWKHMSHISNIHVVRQCRNIFYGATVRASAVKTIRISHHCQLHPLEVAQPIQS